MTTARTTSDRWPGRTVKQPLTWICMNPECREDGQRFRFQADYPRCPKCTIEGEPNVSLRTLIHFIVKHPYGQIQGKYGRYQCVCMPTSPYIATGDNSESLTNDPDRVSCSSCLRLMKKNGIEFSNNPSVRLGTGICLS